MTAGTGETLLGRSALRVAWKAWSDNRCGAGKRVGAERESEAVVVPIEPCGQHKEQARQVRDALAERLTSVGLELHPDKTHVVYCQTRTGVTIMRSRRSRSWGTRFVRGWPRTGGESIS